MAVLLRVSWLDRLRRMRQEEMARAKRMARVMMRVVSLSMVSL